MNITELDIGFPKGSAGKLTAADYAKQGHLYRQFMDVFLEEPNMGEFVIWGLTDAHSWLDEQQGKTEGLLFDKQYKPKPAYDSVMASLKAHPASEVKTPYPDSILNPPDTTAKDTTVKDTTVKDTTVRDTTVKDTSDAIKTFAKQNNISTHIAGRTLFITGATAMNSAKIDVFDMQGRPIFSTENSKGVFDLSPIADGLYVLRIRSGSANLVKKISIR